MGLTEELFECNFMTATKGNFLGLTKLLTPWIICFTKCTSHWKQSQWRRDSFPHFSAPLLTTVPNKRQLVRLLWRDNDECGETWIFSPWEDIFVQTLAQPQSAQNIQDRYLFCLGLPGQMMRYQVTYPKLSLFIVKFIGWYLVGLNPCQAIPGGDMIREVLVSRDLETSTRASRVKSDDLVAAGINSLSLN